MKQKLSELYPHLLKEWDEEKNEGRKFDNYTKGSEYKAHWKCEKNHTWRTMIKDRVAKAYNCPYCMNRKVQKGYNDLATTHPEIAKEWDYEGNEISPSEIVAGSHTEVSLICGKNHKWKTRLEKRVAGRTCPYCRNREVLAGFNDICTTHKYLLKDWNYNKNIVNPNTVKATSKKKVWWICSYCENEYERNPYDKVKNLKCPNCKKSIEI